MIDLKEVEKFFFKAMLEGWAGNGEKITIPQMPGYKAITFREGDLYLLDCYSKTPDATKSAGTTTIFFKDAPVWVMNYGGYYEKAVIQFLKEAILKSYRSNEFVGGRGPASYTEDSLVYNNTVQKNDFSNFRGREVIFDWDVEKNSGYHQYWGMSLI